MECNPYDCIPGMEVGVEVPRDVKWARTTTKSVIRTTDNDTFFDVCARIGIQKHHYRLYMLWLGMDYGPTSAFKVQLPGDSYWGAHFCNPWGNGTKGKKKRVQKRFKCSTVFPCPAGEAWTRMRVMYDFKTSRTNAPRVESENVCALMNRILEEMAEDRWLADEINACASDDEWPDWDLSKYTGADGRILPPSSVVDAQTRPDWPRWEAALNLELKQILKDYPVLGEP